MSVVLIQKEDEHDFLMHHGIIGMKRGVRRWQDENGDYTPEGREHYGIGPPRKKGESKDAGSKKQGGNAKTSDPNFKEVDPKSKEGRKLIREVERRVTTAEMKRRIQDRINKFNERNAQKRKEREEAKAKEEAAQKEEQKNIRDMTDKELDERVARLELEKKYSELLNERANREKGPLAATASKLFKDAATNLAKRSLSTVVDSMVSKMSKESFSLDKYRNADLMSLDSDTLSKVSRAMTDAETIDRIRKKLRGNNSGQST